jgi:hypothetical protein
MRRVCTASLGEPVEVPDNEVNAHLGNPGQEAHRVMESNEARGKMVVVL